MNDCAYVFSGARFQSLHTQKACGKSAMSKDADSLKLKKSPWQGDWGLQRSRKFNDHYTR